MVFDMNYSRDEYPDYNSPNDNYGFNSQQNNINNLHNPHSQKELEYQSSHHNVHHQNGINEYPHNILPPALPNSNQLYNIGQLDNISNPNTADLNNYTTNDNRYNDGYFNSTVLQPISNNNNNNNNYSMSNDDERRSSNINLGNFPLQNMMHSPLLQPQNLAETTNNLRFECVLEAQTAAAQRIDECSLTYLNKSQLYGITLNDHDKYDGELTSYIKITFHEESHRRMAGAYWSFWLGQQHNNKLAKAIQIDKTASSNVNNIVDTAKFDQIKFDWNGSVGGKIYVKFNCLSTDFSRVKGVKGIPLRIELITKIKDQTINIIECSFCKVKLFRDKGAERKNKDDQRHLDKVFDKMKGKTIPSNNSGLNSPLLMMFAPVCPVTVFTELILPNNFGYEAFNSNYLVDETTTNYDEPLKKENKFFRNKKFDSLNGEFPELADVDPNYIPNLNKRKKLLCVYIQFSNESIYRAIYLDSLSTQDLCKKILEKANLNTNISNNIVVYRINKKGFKVVLDDSAMKQIDDEQDMKVEYDFDNLSSTVVSLSLTF